MSLTDEGTLCAYGVLACEPLLDEERLACSECGAQNFQKLRSIISVCSKQRLCEKCYQNWEKKQVGLTI